MSTTKLEEYRVVCDFRYQLVSVISFYSYLVFFILLIHSVSTDSDSWKTTSLLILVTVELLRVRCALYGNLMEHIQWLMVSVFLSVFPSLSLSILILSTSYDSLGDTGIVGCIYCVLLNATSFVLGTLAVINLIKK
jgi:Predicted membrane protein